MTTLHASEGQRLLLLGSQTGIADPSLGAAYRVPARFLAAMPSLLRTAQPLLRSQRVGHHGSSIRLTAADEVQRLTTSDLEDVRLVAGTFFAAAGSDHLAKMAELTVSGDPIGLILVRLHHSICDFSSWAYIAADVERFIVLLDTSPDQAMAEARRVGAHRLLEWMDYCEQEQARFDQERTESSLRWRTHLAALERRKYAVDLTISREQTVEMLPFAPSERRGIWQLAERCRTSVAAVIGALCAEAMCRSFDLDVLLVMTPISLRELLADGSTLAAYCVNCLPLVYQRCRTKIQGLSDMVDRFSAQFDFVIDNRYMPASECYKLLSARGWSAQAADTLWLNMLPGVAKRRLEVEDIMPPTVRNGGMSVSVRGAQTDEFVLEISAEVKPSASFRAAIDDLLYEVASLGVIPPARSSSG